MAEPATKEKTSLMMPDWSQFPEELLHIISKNLENYFDVVHARSVRLCTFEKIHLFLSRVQTPAAAAAAVSASEFLLGGIGRDKSEDNMELPSPLRYSVKVKIPGSDPTMMNILDCHILPLGNQYIISVGIRKHGQQITEAWLFFR